MGPSTQCSFMVIFILFWLFNLAIWEPLSSVFPLSPHSLGIESQRHCSGNRACQEWHQGVLEPVTPKLVLPIWWQIQIQMARTLSRSLWASWSRSFTSSSRPLLTVTWGMRGVCCVRTWMRAMGSPAPCHLQPVLPFLQAKKEEERPRGTKAGQRATIGSGGGGGGWGWLNMGSADQLTHWP